VLCWPCSGSALGYWGALVLAPLVVGVLGVLIERLILRHLHQLDHLYGLLVTFGLALMAEGFFRLGLWHLGSVVSGPGGAAKVGSTIGIMFLPLYRAWVLVASLAVCFAAWFVIERTSLGARLRAATERPQLTQALGINVPVMVTATYAAGVALAAYAGVLAAPIMQVNPVMGSNLIIVVFAVVVIGGMGSILGSIVTGIGLGLIEGLTKVFYPEASSIVIFVTMVLVLLVRPAGLFGKTA